MAGTMKSEVRLKRNGMSAGFSDVSFQIGLWTTACPAGAVCDEPPLATFVYGTARRIARWLARSLKGVLRRRGTGTDVSLFERCAR